MAKNIAEIQALQAVVTGLSAQSFSHRVHGLVFGAQGLTKLADKYAAHADEEMTWVEKFVNRILDLGGEVKLEGTPAATVYTDIVAYLEAEKQVSIDGIAQVTKLMPVFAEDFVAYEDMKAYLIDEGGDLQETCKELDVIKLIGLKNWYATQL